MYVHKVDSVRAFDVKAYKYFTSISVLGTEKAEYKDNGVVEVSLGDMKHPDPVILEDPCTKEQLSDALIKLAERVREMEW